MPEKVRDLRDFVREIARLLRLIDQCKEVLFRSGFREHLATSVKEVAGKLDDFAHDERFERTSKYPEFEQAGLAGSQLNLKLESFESDLIEFQTQGGIEALEKALDKGSIILGSLGGAIPGFGSFAQELVDFLLKELRRRLLGGRRVG